MSKIPHFIHNTDIGQNFLIDHSVVDFMIENAKLTPEDKVLEIGPGEGMLTEGLLASPCSSLCTIELDERLKHVIEMLAIQNSKMSTRWGDAVQFDYENELPFSPNRIIANLPYHITTPLLWAFLEKLAPKDLNYMLLMVQLESGERISSKEGHRERSPLGITIEAMGASKILRKVPPTSFRPQPRVNSCLIEIKLEKNRELANDRTWRGLLSRSFAQRRKTLVNNWISGYNDVTKDIALSILERNGLKPSSRAEELTLDSWFALLKQPEFYLKPKV
ncbi:MAG: 16S rRNA (adenine(1518)-N(6)/adenine(1519)-N(6))-dimethyltransferase RsmA [Synergistaceae bacterium]